MCDWAADGKESKQENSMKTKQSGVERRESWNQENRRGEEA
jgi:hypothetical protein